MRIFKVFLSLCLLTGLTGCSKKVVEPLVPPSDVITYIDEFGFVQADNLTEIIDHARREEKLVFLDVYADWCLPCKLMDEEVFTDDRLARYYQERFISYKVNAEKGTGPQIAELYQVPGFPTFLFLDTRGRVLVKKIGSAPLSEMYDLADSSVAKASLGN